MVINTEKLREEYNELSKVTEGSGYTEWRGRVKKEFNNTTLIQKKDYLHYVQSRAFLLKNRKTDMDDFISPILTMVVMFFSSFFSCMYGFYGKNTDILTAFANSEKLSGTSYERVVDFYGRNINQLLYIMMMTFIFFVLYRLIVCCIDFCMEKDRLRKIEFFNELEEVVKELLELDSE